MISASNASAILRQQHRIILEEWEAAVRTNVPDERVLDHATIRDHVPQILDELAEVLAGAAGETADADARTHGLRRLAQSMTLRDALADLALLRCVAIRHLPNADPATAESVHAYFDRAMTEAAAEMLLRTEQRAKSDADIRDRLLGILGHDLRNPLGAISIGVHLILADPTLRPMARRAAERVASSSARMLRMIRDLLDLTRSSRPDGLPLERSQMDVVAVASDVVEELRTAHPTVAIELHCDAPRIAGAWDHDRIAQVISNLLSNAIDHGLPDAPVAVAVAERDGAVILSVTNHGAAIPEDARAHIFDAFQRGQEVRGGAQGLGLGLFIVREIARAHGGDIELAKSDGETTVFSVRLPRDAPA